MTFRNYVDDPEHGKRLGIPGYRLRRRPPSTAAHIFVIDHGGFQAWVDCGRRSAVRFEYEANADRFSYTSLPVSQAATEAGVHETTVYD